MTDDLPPPLMSQRRAAALLGWSRGRVEKALADGVLTSNGSFRQVSRADIETILGRRLSPVDWAAAALKIERNTLAGEAA